MSDEHTEATPEKARRGRGNLEADVKAICDKFVTGEIVLEPGDSLTPHRIAKKIVEVMEPDSNVPSTGAVSAVLKRFEKYGFITCQASPYAFSDYTDRGRTEGLRALREEWKAAKKTKDAE